jgi:hypothetical protein
VRVEGEAGMNNKEKIMAILDEIKSLSSDRITENFVDALQKRVEWAYEYAEKCDLYKVLFAVGRYTWFGGEYRGLKQSDLEKGLIEEEVLVKIEKKIYDAEDLLARDLAKILQEKCGCTLRK